MTPEDILRPFLKRFQIPDTLVRLLYLLLQYEIENNYPSLQCKEDQAPIRFAKGLDFIFSRLPRIYDLEDGKFYAPLETLANIDDSAREYLYSLRSHVEYDVYVERRRVLQERISEFQDAIDRRPRGKDAPPETDSLVSQARRYVRQYQQELKELKEPEPEPYLTPFWSKLLSFNVAFDLPYRNEHTVVLGRTGTGKTELLKWLAYQDIQSGAAVIVLAPKDNICEVLAKVPSNRAIWVSDWSQVGLNLLDLDISFLVYVFEGLLESEPTWKQRAFLTKYLPKIRSIQDLRTVKVESVYRETVEQVGARLDLLPPIVDEIFSRPTNINIEDVMQGKVLLLDTQGLGDGAPLIGRFCIALVAKAIERRTAKNPCYVYIDEAPVYITSYMKDILNRARSKNVGLTLVFQDLTQTPLQLKAAVHNTAIKFIGTVNRDDAVDMGKEIRVEPDTLQALPRLTFMLSGVVKPFPIKIKPGSIDRLATSHANHFTSPRPVPQPKSEEKYTDDPGTGTSME